MRKNNYDVLDQNTNNKYDQIKINTLRCRHYTHQGQWQAAVDQGFNSLKLFGFDLPERIETALLQSIWAEIKSAYSPQLFTLNRLKTTITR